jgi:hypothetical protein
MMQLRAPFILVFLLSTGCESRFTEVDPPFYLHYWENGDVDLIRCPRGPGSGCSVDHLPKNVLAAGADKHFVVARSNAGYFYFARVPQETGAWGNNPERVVGPLDAADFQAAKRQLRLPEFEVER